MTEHKIPTVDAVTLGRQCKCNMPILYRICILYAHARSVHDRLSCRLRHRKRALSYSETGQTRSKRAWKLKLKDANTTFLLRIFISFARYEPVEWFWLYHSLDMTLLNGSEAGLMNTVINYASGKPSDPLRGYSLNLWTYACMIQIYDSPAKSWPWCTKCCWLQLW